MPGVYAAGDVARYADAVFGGRRRVEHVFGAKRQGKTAGANMAGAGLVHRDALYFWSEVCGIEVEFVGDLTREADRAELDGSLSDAAFVQRRYAGGRLTAAVLVGQEEAKAGELAEEILNAWAE